jgi:hypothetical protein
VLFQRQCLLLAAEDLADLLEEKGPARCPGNTDIFCARARDRSGEYF